MVRRAVEARGTKKKKQELERLKDAQRFKVQELERQLEDERKHRADLEKKRTEAQWKEPNDEEWEDYDGLEEWYNEKDEQKNQEKGTSSKDTSFIIVPS